MLKKWLQAGIVGWVLLVGLTNYKLLFSLREPCISVSVNIFSWGHAVSSWKETHWRNRLTPAPCLIIFSPGLSVSLVFLLSREHPCSTGWCTPKGWNKILLFVCVKYTHIYIHKQIHGIFVTLNFGRWAIRRKMCWEGKYLKKKKKRLLRRIIMEKSRDAQAFSLFSPENNLHSFWVGTELEILFLFIDFLLVSQYSENLMPLSLKPFLGSLLQSDSNLRLGITLISVCQSVVSTFSAKSVTCLYFLNIYRICTSCSLCCCGLILLYSLILMTV